ncbi:MAG: hypothetical protein V4850_26665 [Myxococcota bacterium]
MEITCPRCHSEHEIEPPPSARARGPRSLKFRCSHCGHTFSVDPEAPKESTSPPPLGEKPAGESIQLVQVAGQIWSVPDMAALHQWILERRLDRDALVSKHGLRWVRAGERDDLAMFFSASDALSFQERNLRTEMPPHDDEIVVDAPEADEADGFDATTFDAASFDATSIDANASAQQGGGMPVATGPGPAVGGYPRGLGTVMMDFDGGDDTQEQTVQTGGLDETPIDGIPASFDRAEAAERTERLPPTSGVRDIPLPMGVSTVTPGPAPAGSAAVGIPPHAPGTPTHGMPPLAVLPGPAVVASAPLRVVSSPVGGGPSVGPGPAPHAGPQVASPAASKPVAPGFAPAAPGAASNASQTFFLDGAPGSPTPPRRDVFDDPPAASGINWVLWGGLAAVAAAAVLAVVMWTGRGADPRGVDPRGGDPTGTARTAETPPPLAAATLPGAGEVPGAPDVAGAQATAAGASGTASATPAVVPPVAASASGAGAGSVKAPASTVAPAASRPAAPQAPAQKAAAAQPAAAQTSAASTGGSPKKLVEQGWKAVEAGDYTKAHGLFDRALQGGTGADALFGRGYANEKLGDTNSASDDYCRALSGSAVTIDMQREIEGGLRRLGRTCS